MKIDFTGRKVLVSGSTAGIGHAAAQGFLAAGASVVVNVRTEERVASAVRTLGTGAIGFAGDLATEEACSRLVEAHPTFDVVVNSLGVFGLQDFFETSDSEWER